ncbi:MAG: class I tRNA ligase family protein, partial [Clostridia bacterium]
ISFTAEEIWSAMNHTEKENVESPMLADYPVSNDEWDNKEIAEKWEKIIKVKNIVAKDLELARAEKTIGNSLDAKVTIYAEGEEYKFLKENEELIKLVLIVSGLEIQENNRKQEEKLGVKVEHATGEKCERCWMYNDNIEDGI